MVKYRMTFDLHTHTVIRKDGGREILHAKGTVEENVLAALEKGLSCIGISNHGPGHITYGMPMDYLTTLRGEIEEARQRHPQIQILLGVEANVINHSGKLDVLEEEFSRFDYIMAGYHYGIFGENPGRAALIHGANWLYENAGFIRSLADKPLPVKAEERQRSGETGADLLRRVNTQMMVEAVTVNRPKVLTHPGDKGPFDIDAAARACEAAGTWMEINNYHRDLTVEGIRTAAKYNVKFVIGSDAHSPENVGRFELGLERALQAGIPIERIANVEVVRAEAKKEAGQEPQPEKKKGRRRYAVSQAYRKKDVGAVYRKRMAERAGE